MIPKCLGMDVCVPQTGLVLKQQTKTAYYTNFHIGSGATRSTPRKPNYITTAPGTDQFH